MSWLFMNLYETEGQDPKFFIFPHWIQCPLPIRYAMRSGPRKADELPPSSWHVIGLWGWFLCASKAAALTQPGKTQGSCNFILCKELDGDTVSSLWWRGRNTNWMFHLQRAILWCLPWDPLFHSVNSSSISTQQTAMYLRRPASLDSQPFMFITCICRTW